MKILFLGLKTFFNLGNIFQLFVYDVISDYHNHVVTSINRRTFDVKQRCLLARCLIKMKHCYSFLLNLVLLSKGAAELNQKLFQCVTLLRWKKRVLGEYVVPWFVYIGVGFFLKIIYKKWHHINNILEKICSDCVGNQVKIETFFFKFNIQDE